MDDVKLSQDAFSRAVTRYRDRFGETRMSIETAEMFWKKLRHIESETFEQIWDDLLGRDFAFGFGKVLEIFHLDHRPKGQENRNWGPVPERDMTELQVLGQIPDKMRKIKEALVTGQVKDSDAAQALFWKWVKVKGVQHLVPKDNHSLQYWIDSLREIEWALNQGIKVELRKDGAFSRRAG